jgi:sulfur-carrier protein
MALLAEHARREHSSGGESGSAGAALPGRVGLLEGRLQRYPDVLRARSGRMAKVEFTPNLRRHLAIPTVEVPGGTLRSVLDSVFVTHERLRGYVLDDQGALRKHVTVFVDGRRVADRTNLSDPVGDASEVYVLQALSGG